MKNYKGYFYSNGGYAIGEISDAYINGLGYNLYTDNTFAMGEFTNGKIDGWTCYNTTKGQYVVERKEDGQATECVCLVSNDEGTWIYQQNEEGKPEGYGLYIWPNGSWKYSFNDLEDGETRAVQYDAQNNILALVYCNSEGKNIWVKQIAHKYLGDGFALPFMPFKQKAYTQTGDFIPGENCINPEYNGPSMDYHVKEKCTSIGAIENGKYEGLVFEDFAGSICVTHFHASNRNGMCFREFKDDCQYKVLFYKNNQLFNISIIGWATDGVIEIRRDVDDGKYDCIRVDKDFNVDFYEGYDEEKEEYDDLHSYDYEKEYKNKNDDEDESSSRNEVEDDEEDDEGGPTRVEDDEDEQPRRKTTRRKPADDEEDEDDSGDLEDELRDIFKKYKRNK